MLLAGWLCNACDGWVRQIAYAWQIAGARCSCYCTYFSASSSWPPCFPFSGGDAEALSHFSTQCRRDGVLKFCCVCVHTAVSARRYWLWLTGHTHSRIYICTASFLLKTQNVDFKSPWNKFVIYELFHYIFNLICIVIIKYKIIIVSFSNYFWR